MCFFLLQLGHGSATRLVLWESAFGSFADWAVDGEVEGMGRVAVDARLACCACGGGSKLPLPLPLALAKVDQSSDVATAAHLRPPTSVLLLGQRDSATEYIAILLRRLFEARTGVTRFYFDLALPMRLKCRKPTY